MGSRALSEHRHRLGTINRRKEVIHICVVHVCEPIALCGSVNSGREVAPHSEPVVVVAGLPDVAEVTAARESPSVVVLSDGGLKGVNEAAANEAVNHRGEYQFTESPAALQCKAEVRPRGRPSAMRDGVRELIAQLLFERNQERLF